MEDFFFFEKDKLSQHQLFIKNIGGHVLPVVLHIDQTGFPVEVKVQSIYN